MQLCTETVMVPSLQLWGFGPQVVCCWVSLEALDIDGENALEEWDNAVYLSSFGTCLWPFLWLLLLWGFAEHCPASKITCKNHMVTLHKPVPPLVFSSLYMWHWEALLSEECGVLVSLKPSGWVLVLLTALSSTRALVSCSQQAQFELWDLGVKTFFRRKHQVISNNRSKCAVSSANKGHEISPMERD